MTWPSVGLLGLASVPAEDVRVRLKALPVLASTAIEAPNVRAGASGVTAEIAPVRPPTDVTAPAEPPVVTESCAGLSLLTDSERGAVGASVTTG